VIVDSAKINYLSYEKSFSNLYRCKWIARLSVGLYCITYCITGLFSPSENNDSCGKRDQGMVKSVLSFGNPEADFPPPKFAYSQPFVS
jgi:hypothetical protein